MDNWDKWLKSKEYKPITFAPPIKKEFVWWFCVTDNVKILSDGIPLCPICTTAMEPMNDSK